MPPKAKQASGSSSKVKEDKVIKTFTIFIDHERIINQFFRPSDWKMSVISNYFLYNDTISYAFHMYITEKQICQS